MLANHHAPNTIALTALVLFLAACALPSALIPSLTATPTLAASTTPAPTQSPTATLGDFVAPRSSGA